jgi:hypothetical protein
MKAGKREDRLFFIIDDCLPFVSLRHLVLGHGNIPHGFFIGAGWATIKRNNIKENVK